MNWTVRGSIRCPVCRIPTPAETRRRREAVIVKQNKEVSAPQRLSGKIDSCPKTNSAHLSSLPGRCALCGNENPGLPDGLAPSKARVHGLRIRAHFTGTREPVGGCSGVCGVVQLRTFSSDRASPSGAAVRDCSGGVDAADCDVRVRRVNCMWFIEEILRLVPCSRLLDD